MKRIPFSKANHGMELCLCSAEELTRDAELLAKSRSYTHAYFFLITAYEELAKCLRIAQERDKNTVNRNDLFFETWLFGNHAMKYELAMNYLDEWISAGDAIKQRFFHDVEKSDTKDLKDERAKLRKEGSLMRQHCLFTDLDDNGNWIEKTKVNERTILLNTKMITSMITGFRSLLRLSDLSEEGGFAPPPSDQH